MTRYYTHLLILTLIFTSFAAKSQCLVQHEPLDERIENSDLIIEAEVIASQSFIESTSDHIYTRHTLLVSQAFKGNGKARTQYLFTWGGQVGDRYEEANPALHVQRGDKGIFLLSNPSHYRSGSLQFSGYWGVSGPTSLLRYNQINRNVVDHDEVIAVVSEDFYTQIQNKTGNRDQWNPISFPIVGSNKKAFGISSFNPTTITGGQQEILTITGSGFGNTYGQIGFTNADDGGKTFLFYSDSAYIVSWTDTEIEVYVPSKAGTGDIAVITASNTQYNSTSSLTVLYTRLELVYQSTSNKSKLYPLNLVDNNGSGGYDWSFNKDFAKKQNAKQSFLRALQQWRCSTLVNFQIDTNSTTNVNSVARDGVHTVMFQNANAPISSGALAVTFNQWSGCYNTTTKDWHWYLSDVDMVFDDELSSGYSWNYGPGKPASKQYDLESVALHELGHGHQLNHIIDTKGVMHYSITNGQTKRVLNTLIDVEAGNDVLAASIKTLGCSSTKATKKISANDCKFINIIRPVASFTVSNTKFCVGDSAKATNTSSPSGVLKWSFPTGTTFRYLDADKESLMFSFNSGGPKEIWLIVNLDGVLDSTSVTITSDKTPGTLDNKLTDVSCYGGNDGRIKLEFVRGTPPFTVEWNNSMTGTTITNLVAGEYTGTITDNNMCVGTVTEIIEQPDSMMASVGSSPLVNPAKTGMAWVYDISGGINPYKLKWDDNLGSTTDTIVVTENKSYTVTVTDKNLCELALSIEVESRLGIGNSLTSDFYIVYAQTSKTLKINYLNNSKPFIVSIMNHLGQTVKTASLAGSVSELSLTELQPGIYFVNVNGQTSSERFIVQ